MKKLLTFIITCVFLTTSTNVIACNGPTLTGSVSTLPNSFTIQANTSLLLTNSVSLSGGGIWFENNAQLILAPGVTLTLDVMGVSGCPSNTQLWDKVKVSSGATIIMNNCRVENGREAIYSEGGGNFQITNCYFINNKTHLIVKDFQGNHPGYITSSYLLNEDFTSSPFLNSADYEASIKIENVGHVQIGDNSSPKNIISKGRYGVYSKNSSVTIENNQIELFIDSGDKGVFNDGGHNIIVRNNKFKKCEVGVEQDNLVSSLVKDNQFEVGERGIFLKDCQTSDVIQNTIKPVNGEAIEVRNMANNYPINITNNVVSSADIGIVAQSVQGTLTYPDIDIVGNNLYHTRIGIFGSYLKSLHNINGNTIGYQQTGNTQVTQGIGIYLKKSWYTTIENNHIEDWGASTSFPSSNGTGILIEQSESTTVTDNKVIDANKGIAYAHSFSGVTLECNTLEECYDGFYFDGNATNSSNPFEVVGVAANGNTNGISSGNKWVNTLNYDILNNSSVQLDWWYNINNPFNYTPNSTFGLINQFSSGDDAQCMPAPNRLAQEMSELKMYPNPCIDEITIEISDENGTIQLFNLMGQMIFEHKLSQGENKIDIGYLSPGIYQSRISSASEVLKTEKIIISR